MPVKGAEEFLEELLQAVRPPKGVAIVLRERKPKDQSDVNWVAITGNLPPAAMSKYSSAVVEMRRQHPRIEWDGITEREGEWRRIARWLSEVEE